MGGHEERRGRWDLRTWITVVLGVACVIAGGIIGMILGTSLVIWLIEGGEPFREFIYAHPSAGEFSLPRIVGLIAGAAVGAGICGFLALFFLFLKLRPSDGA
jgi:hypothetical protein